MLGKLFKYEMRATSRVFVWLYIAFAAIAVVNALIGPNAVASLGVTADGNDIQTLNPVQTLVPGAFQGVFITLYGIAVFAIIVVTFVVVILRFYKNLLGDEGYLMMTLPVSREQHIISKLSAAMVWYICSIVLVFLSILLLIATMGGMDAIREGIDEMIKAGVPVGRFVSLFIVLLIIGCASNILMLYAAMAIGPNLLKNRVGGSILAYIIIYIVSMLICFGIMLGTAASQFGPGVLHTNTDMTGYMAANSTPIINAVMGSSIIFCVIVAVGCWFLTRYMIKRKLNLA